MAIIKPSYWTVLIPLLPSPSLSAFDLPMPFVSLAFSAFGIYLCTRRCLHPIYSFCISSILFLAWILMSVFFYWGDVSEMADEEQTYVPFEERFPRGPIVLKDICIVSIMLL